ncbi:hypothetical protein M0R45_028471 [Rubus argutus]|uniref:Uncharacterized protein n=1 Tax=Rubus argutus TaxID=59490 RepID=A0AAW1W5F0_RUBAR
MGSAKQRVGGRGSRRSWARLSSTERTTAESEISLGSGDKALGGTAEHGCDNVMEVWLLDLLDWRHSSGFNLTSKFLFYAKHSIPDAADYTFYKCKISKLSEEKKKKKNS